MANEIESHRQMGTWALVPRPPGRNIVGNKWVFKPKVKTAFLQGELEADTHVCKLQRPLYGLKQSPRQWNKTLHKRLTNLGFRRMATEPCFYIKHDAHGQLLVVGAFVDDLIIVGKKVSALELRATLQTVFEMTDLGEMKKFLGMEIDRDREARTITVSQQSYLAGVLEKFRMEECNPVSSPIVAGYHPHKRQDDEPAANKPLYQSIVGSLIYAANGTRIDITAATGIAGQYMADPSELHMKNVKRILRYIKGTIDKKLTLGGIDAEIKLEAWADSDWGSNPDCRKSRAGYLVKLGQGAVMWGSKKQQSVALSSSEAEYMAVSITTRELLWARQFLKELGYPQNQPTPIHEDNRGCIFMSNEHVINSRTKHIDIRHHFIRDAVELNQIKLVACSTAEMVADFLTKGVDTDKIEYCSKMAGLSRPRGRLTRDQSRETPPLPKGIPEIISTLETKPSSQARSSCHFTSGT